MLPEEEKQQIAAEVAVFKQEKAKFDYELTTWDETGNDIITLAKQMCMIMMEMTDFTRGKQIDKTCAAYRSESITAGGTAVTSFCSRSHDVQGSLPRKFFASRGARTCNLDSGNVRSTYCAIFCCKITNITPIKKIRGLQLQSLRNWRKFVYLLFKRSLFTLRSRKAWLVAGTDFFSEMKLYSKEMFLLTWIIKTVFVIE